MVRRAGFELPGSAAAAAYGLPEMQAPQAGADAEDVAGAWEDLSFGIASIWTG